MADRNEVSWISSENSRRAKSAVAVAMSFIILLSGLAFVSWTGYTTYMEWLEKDDYIGTGDQSIQVVVNANEGWATVADRLAGQEVIQDPSLFEKEALRIVDGPQPGTWNIKTRLPAKTAAEIMTDPKNLVTIKLTIPEGKRLSDVFKILIDKLGLTQEEIDDALKTIMDDPGSIGVKFPVKGSLEGVLFPDTYLLYPPQDTDPTSVLTYMAGEFNSVLKELKFEDRAKAIGVKPMDALIVASIIEAEVNHDEYRGMVAQAIYNRLKQDMNLEIDSTVNYGLDRTGEGLSLEELAIDTPYNTYMHAGLPPTPINLPSRASLEAAVNPIPSDNLFWVTIDLDSGETLFAETFEQHEENAKKLTKWCEENPGFC